MLKRTVVYIVTLLIMGIDIFLIGQLLTHAIGSSSPEHTIFFAVILVGCLDFWPTYIFTPNITKIIRKITTKHSNNYKTTKATIAISVIVFVSAAVFYFFLSITFQERFIQAGNAETATIMAIAAGLIPIFITTPVSCSLMFIGIGDGCIKDEINKMNKLMEEYGELTRACAEIDIFLENLEGHVDIIENNIKVFECKTEEYKLESANIEKSNAKQADATVKNSLYKSLDDLALFGNAIFDRYDSPEQKLKVRRREWNDFCSKLKKSLQNKLDLV